MPRPRTNSSVGNRCYQKVMRSHAPKTAYSMTNTRQITDRGIIKSKELKVITI